jgi:O-antigen/teichoic acid export membrane protein
MSSPKHSTNRVIKNTGILYAKMGITMFISLYTTRLILGALGVADFGIFNVVGGAISMLTFLNAAMAGATQRFMSYAEGAGNKERMKSIFNVSVILHFLIALTIGLGLEIVGYFLFHGILNIPENRIPAAQIIYQFMIVSTMFTIMTVPYDAVVNAHENMLYYAIVGIFESLLKMIVAIIVVSIYADKLIVYGLLMACISIIVMIIMRIYCNRKYIECVIAPKKYFDKVLMIEMTGFAGWSFLSTSTSMLGNYGLGIVLNHFFGAVLNAAAGIAGQLNGQLLVFSNTMMKALNPAIVKSEGGGDRKNMLKMSLMGCKFSFFLFAFFAVPFLIETPYILTIWLKNVPEWTILFCRLSIIQTMIEQLFLPLGTSISAQGNIKKISLINSLLNLIPLPFIYILFKLGNPPYIMYIVSIAFWAIISGLIIIYFTIINCDLKLGDYLKAVLYKSLIVFFIPLAIGIIPIYIMQDSFFRLIIVIIASMFSFLSLLFFVGLTSEEKSHMVIVSNTINKKLFKRN